MAIQLTPKAATTKTVMLQIDPDLYGRIKVAAKHYNMPASVAMRQMLEQAIQEIEANLG
jgi:antitoxin component of RelBE/YafQ-DinJ toxin-antitoxin module